VEARGHVATEWAPVYFLREPMIEIRLPRTTDAPGCAELAALVIGRDRAGPFIKSHMERHHLMVAEADKEIVGFLAYRTDWFQCTFVSLVVVREDFRRKGIAREFFNSVEVVSPSPRIFSSTEETNAASIRMHTALGFQPSGHIDNLPQGVRELLFYKRTPPRYIS
jgi:GNAT superfamily N-acetyltransferase